MSGLGGTSERTPADIQDPTIASRILSMIERVARQKVEERVLGGGYVSDLIGDLSVWVWGHADEVAERAYWGVDEHGNTILQLGLLKRRLELRALDFIAKYTDVVKVERSYDEPGDEDNPIELDARIQMVASRASVVSRRPNSRQQAAEETWMRITDDHDRAVDINDLEPRWTHNAVLLAVLPGVAAGDDFEPWTAHHARAVANARAAFDRLAGNHRGDLTKVADCLQYIGMSIDCRRKAGIMQRVADTFNVDIEEAEKLADQLKVAVDWSRLQVVLSDRRGKGRQLDASGVRRRVERALDAWRRELTRHPRRGGYDPRETSQPTTCGASLRVLNGVTINDVAVPPARHRIEDVDERVGNIVNLVVLSYKGPRARHEVAVEAQAWLAVHRRQAAAWVTDGQAARVSHQLRHQLHGRFPRKFGPEGPFTGFETGLRSEDKPIGQTAPANMLLA